MALNLSPLNQVSLLVVGDVMLDRYWHGDVERISPEAPVPVVSVKNIEERMGGAANVANNILRVGSKCMLLSVIGDDEPGRELLRLINESGIESKIRTDKNARTTVKLRVISRQQQLIRADFEERPCHEVLALCLDDFKTLVGQRDAIILSDYGKGGLLHISDMIEAARNAGTPVMVDPKGGDFQQYRGATMITPNLNEFEAVVGRCPDDAVLESRVQELIADLDIETLLLTRSEKGMTLFFRDGATYHCAARAKEVYDVSGAGDSVIAVMTAALTAGFTHQQAVDIANAAAGIVVGRLGPAAATQAEIEAVL